MSELVTDNPQGEFMDVATAKDMAEALHQAYPGHLWAVSCDTRTGFADVRNLALTGNWGFRIFLGNVYSASAFKKHVIRAGGEILERYRLSRGRFDEVQLSDLTMDFAGRIKADL